MYQEKSQPDESTQKSTFWLPVAIIIAAVLLVGTLVMGLLVVGAFVGSSNSSQSCTPGAPGSVGVSGSTTGTAITAADPSLSVPKELRDQQLRNAKVIDQTTADLGLSGTASKIAIIAAMGESTLINLTYGDEGQGVTNPDGSPTTSKGLFQQQTPSWGTVEEVTNPQHATTSFLLGANHKGTSQGLVTVAGWETGEITQVIHKVQRNANPNHYAASYGSANQIIQEAGIDVTREADEAKQASWRTATGPGGSDDGADTGAADTVANVTGCSPADGGIIAAGVTNQAGNTYPWDALSPAPGVYNADPLNFYYGECTSYAAWKVNEAMGGTATNIIFDNAYGGNRKGDGGQWKAAWEASGWKVSNTPKVDSVAWWGPNGGEGIGSAGHVGWVDEITADGKVFISEYNNAYYGPPGHEYSRRTVAIDASEVNAYLYAPESR